jgi:hypothetical protein
MNPISSPHNGEGVGVHRATPTSTAFQGAMNGLREELNAHSADPARDGHLRDALLLVATQARTEGIQPEHLVIAFRQLWDGDPPVMAREVSSRRDALRWRLVSALINGYYANSPGTADLPG